jgi:hypothetical protein
MQMTTSREMSTIPYNDMLVSQIILRSVNSINNVFVEKGVDGLHADAEQHGGEEPFNILMGIIPRMLDGTLLSAESLDPLTKQMIKRYMRLCQILIQPPLPPEVRAKIQQSQQAQQAKPIPGTSTGGGWAE